MGHRAPGRTPRRTNPDGQIWHAPHAQSARPRLRSPGSVQCCSPRGWEPPATIPGVAAAMPGVSCWHGHADHAGDAGGTGGTATSPFSAIHWQLWRIPASSSSWPRSSVCSQRACKQSCSVPGWDSSRGEKESLDKIKYNILQYLRRTQQCRSSPLAQRSIASGGLVLFAAAQTVKGRPCLSGNLEKVLEGQGGATQAMIPGEEIARTEHGRATTRHGQVHRRSSRRKHNAQHHQTLLILT